ncbi:NnrS family protein [Bradyrhizobium sp. NP1]|uniref:NnrS family protein n=1 Tax=Bradyrhizobium sp. NP1 TaxID=3049772 RepID=UPI0025A5D37C|nr:NnrS family protein [Bradyrhizobium sp. NP1]WJR77844.1 NnrS family protein [Bradyrhizobium sp. NP1]
MSIPRLRDYQGPALLSYGFRPFFLFGSIYAAATILIWLPLFEGEFQLPTAFIPRDWHVHEMLFGYVAAVIGGFLLTAVPNWTGRLPLQGMPLATLVSIWIAGRIAVCLSDRIGWAAACAIDALFLLLLAAAAAREIVAGRKWGNLPVVGIVTLLAISNVAFHLESHFHGFADYSTRFAIAIVIVLISLIGGRIVPSFTRNWLARQRPGRLPVPFGRFDSIAVAAGLVALLAWVAAPQSPITGIALVTAGCLHAIRLARWVGYRTTADRLVLILHLAYAFVPFGYLLAGLAAFGVLPSGAGIHAWTGGAIGSMTLAVMTRATLGHTGRGLKASIGTQAIYAAIIAAALLRVCASVATEHMHGLLAAAAIGWVAAFLGFALLYGRALCTPRLA